MKDSIHPAYILIMTACIGLTLSSCGESDKPKTSSKTSTKSSASSELEENVYVVNLPERKPKEILKMYMPHGKHSAIWQEYNDAAEAAMNNQDYKSAEYLLNKSLEINPKEAHTYYLRGRSYYDQFDDRDDQCIEDILKAIDMGERAPGAYEILSSLYDRRKQPEKAIEILTRGTKESFKIKHLLHNRATIYLTQGNKEKALEDYNAILKLDPKYERIHIMRGQLYEQLGDEDKAVADYLAAVKADDSNAIISLKVIGAKFGSVLLSKKGRHKEAIETLTYVINSKKQDRDELLRLRGDEYLHTKQYQKAVDDYTASIKLDPKFARLAFEGRSKAYEMLGKTELADADRKRASRLSEAPAEKPLYQIDRK